MPTSAEYPRRVAMISMHTSPLATPGVGDAGGLNVYVAEVARRLGERGLKVDVFTRAEDPDVDEIVEIHEHTRVISLPAGPREMVSKESLISLLPEFSARVQSRIDSYDVVHSHYWLSGLVGLDLQDLLRHPARAHHAHNGPGEERIARRWSGRRAGGSRARRAPHRQACRCADRQHPRRGHRAGSALRRIGRSNRGRAARSRSAHLPPLRSAEVTRQSRSRPGRAGDLVRRPDPAAEGSGCADSGRGGAGPPQAALAAIC